LLHERILTSDGFIRQCLSPETQHGDDDASNKGAVREISCKVNPLKKKLKFRTPASNWFIYVSIFTAP